MKSWIDRVEEWIRRWPVVGPAWRRAGQVLQFVWVVCRDFAINRCPIRAAALSYATLLALVPLLAVALSISKSFLHDNAAEIVPRLMDKTLAVVAPQLDLMPLPDDVAGPAAPGQATVSPRARQEAVARIQEFIDNIHSGALGAVGSVLLVFLAVRLLMAIEKTLNDIWGVPVGRSVWRKLVYYWTAVTLGPLLIVLATYLTGRAELMAVMGRLTFIPGSQKLLLQLAPFVVMWLAFALMYGLMPNTRVRPSAALAGGVVAGTLWQLNTWLNALYLSRVVTYSKIYGALGIIPVMLISLYLAWLIILFGAQVAHAAQHWRASSPPRPGERTDQRSRELMACRIVLAVCENFLRGQKPPTIDALVKKLDAPATAVTQLVYRLAQGGILARVEDAEGGVLPARSPDEITVADVLEAIRTAPAAARGVSPAGNDAMDRVLAQLDLASRQSAANRRFSELVDCSAR